MKIFVGLVSADGTQADISPFLEPHIERAMSNRQPRKPGPFLLFPKAA